MGLADLPYVRVVGKGVNAGQYASPISHLVVSGILDPNQSAHR